MGIQAHPSGLLRGLLISGVGIASVLPVLAEADASPDSYTLYSYAGPNLAEGVHALEANLWHEELAFRTDGTLLIGVYANRGFIREMRSDGTLFTIAGKHGRDGLENEGGLALETDLGQVYGLVVNGAGTVFASISRSVVCRIEPDGRIYTFAGTWGQVGHSGDGGPAVDAVLDFPSKLLLADDGSLYVTQRYRVSRIDPDGIIETVAGGGNPVDGVGDGGLATDAFLDGGRGLALDPMGRLCIAEIGGSRVRRVELDGTISTIAGNGEWFSDPVDGVPATETSLGDPYAIVFDGDGRLLISDTRNSIIRRVDADGIISTIAGTGVSGYSGDGGPALGAQITDVRDLEFDSNGNLLLSDDDAFRLRSISPAGIITTIGGNGSQFYGGDGWQREQASFGGARDVVFAPDGSAFVADMRNRRIRKVNPAGIVSTFAGTGVGGSGGDGGPAVEATLVPISVDISSTGELYVLDDNRVRRIRTDGVIEAFAGTGEHGDSPNGIPALQAEFDDLLSLDIGPDDTVYLVEEGANRVRYVDGDGLLQTLAGNGVAGSGGDGGPATQASLYDPKSIYVDASGVAYITQYRGHRVRRVGLDGIITTFAGTGVPGDSGDGGPATAAQIGYAFGVVGDEWGSIYISSFGSRTIRRVSPDGVIETIAGNGEIPYLGEGMPALEASLGSPALMEIGPDNSLYVSSYTSGRLLQLVPDQGTPIGWLSLEARSPEPGHVRLSWVANSSRAVRYDVLRKSERFWLRIASLDGHESGEVSYSDTMPPGRESATYQVDVFDGDELLQSLGPVEVRVEAPALRPPSLVARPNPFNPRTTFQCEIPGPTAVSLRIFDTAGRLVRTLAHGEIVTGAFEREWDGQTDDGDAVASGVYFAELRVEGGVASRVKVALVR